MERYEVGGSGNELRVDVDGMKVYDRPIYPILDPISPQDILSNVITEMAERGIGYALSSERMRMLSGMQRDISTRLTAIAREGQRAIIAGLDKVGVTDLNKIGVTSGWDGG